MLLRTQHNEHTHNHTQPRSDKPLRVPRSPKQTAKPLTAPRLCPRVLLSKPSTFLCLLSTAFLIYVPEKASWKIRTEYLCCAYSCVKLSLGQFYKVKRKKTKTQPCLQRAHCHQEGRDTTWQAGTSLHTRTEAWTVHDRPYVPEEKHTVTKEWPGELHDRVAPQLDPKR